MSIKININSSKQHILEEGIIDVDYSLDNNKLISLLSIAIKCVIIIIFIIFIILTLIIFNYLNKFNL